MEAGYSKFSLTVLLVIFFENITIVDVFLSTTLLMILNVIVFKNIFTNTNLKALLIYITILWISDTKLKRGYSSRSSAYVRGMSVFGVGKFYRQDIS